MSARSRISAFETVARDRKRSASRWACALRAPGSGGERRRRGRSVRQLIGDRAGGVRDARALKKGGAGEIEGPVGARHLEKMVLDLPAEFAAPILPSSRATSWRLRVYSTPESRRSGWTTVRNVRTRACEPGMNSLLLVVKLAKRWPIATSAPVSVRRRKPKSTARSRARRRGLPPVTARLRVGSLMSSTRPSA